MVGAGLDRKRWREPRKYEVHYNQKRLDNFSRNRLKKYAFFPWKEFYIMQVSLSLILSLFWVRGMAISEYWWSRIRPAQIQAQVRGWMFRVMAISEYWWCLVSC